MRKTYKPSDLVRNEVKTHQEDSIGISNDEVVEEYSGPDAMNKGEKSKKFVALFKARTILSMIGTMEERVNAKRKLKDMKKRGLASI